jgi:hypothetical protein
MPKGSIRNPGSKKPMVSTKTWSGKQLPLRTKAELNARFKNMMREDSAKTYAAYKGERATARDIRAEPGAGPMTRAKENPVKALKRRAAAKKGK